MELKSKKDYLLDEFFKILIEFLSPLNYQEYLQKNYLFKKAEGKNYLIIEQIEKENEELKRVGMVIIDKENGIIDRVDVEQIIKFLKFLKKNQKDLDKLENFFKNLMEKL